MYALLYFHYFRFSSLLLAEVFFFFKLRYVGTLRAVFPIKSARRLCLAVGPGQDGGTRLKAKSSSEAVIPG